MVIPILIKQSHSDLWLCVVVYCIACVSYTYKPIQYNKPQHSHISLWDCFITSMMKQSQDEMIKRVTQEVTPLDHLTLGPVVRTILMSSLVRSVIHHEDVRRIPLRWLTTGPLEGPVRNGPGGTRP